MARETNKTYLFRGDKVAKKIDKNIHICLR